MSAALANLSMTVAILLAGVSLVLAVVAWLSFRRLGTGRMAWIAVAFTLFTVQGAVAACQAYAERGDASFPALPGLSLLVVVAMYIAVLRR